MLLSSKLLVKVDPRWRTTNYHCVWALTGDWVSDWISLWYGTMCCQIPSRFFQKESGSVLSGYQYYWNNTVLVQKKKDRNGPPSANQVTSRDQPRRGHAVCTLWVHSPTSPCPALSAEAEPISKGHCRKWHHEAESLIIAYWCTYKHLGPKELTHFYRGLLHMLVIY